MVLHQHNLNHLVKRLRPVSPLVFPEAVGSLHCLMLASPGGVELIVCLELLIAADVTASYFVRAMPFAGLRYCRPSAPWEASDGVEALMHRPDFQVGQVGISLSRRFFCPPSSTRQLMNLRGGEAPVLLSADSRRLLLHQLRYVYLLMAKASDQILKMVTTAFLGLV